MTYTVIVTPAAQTDIALAFAYIQERSPLNAQRWLRGLYKMVHTLETLPKRCGRAREADLIGEDIRQTFFKSHRIIFRIEEVEKIVHILHVRHGARAAISPDDTRDDADL